MPLKNGRTTAAIQQILVGSVIPPGTIAPFAGGTVPSGWLLCDGSTASRSTYSALFAAVGTAHGSGDGTTTFHLPDLRGRFLRGADNMGSGAAGRDPGERTTANAGGSPTGVGSAQSDAMQAHRHVWFLGQGSGTSLPFGTAWGANNATYNFYVARNNVGEATTSSQGSPRTSSESRPQNISVEYIIKV